MGGLSSICVGGYQVQKKLSKLDDQKCMNIIQFVQKNDVNLNIVGQEPILNQPKLNGEKDRLDEVNETLKKANIPPKALLEELYKLGKDGLQKGQFINVKLVDKQVTLSLISSSAPKDPPKASDADAKALKDKEALRKKSLKIKAKKAKETAEEAAAATAANDAAATVMPDSVSKPTCANEADRKIWIIKNFIKDPTKQADFLNNPGKLQFGDLDGTVAFWELVDCGMVSGGPVENKGVITDKKIEELIETVNRRARIQGIDFDNEMKLYENASGFHNENLDFFTYQKAGVDAAQDSGMKEGWTGTQLTGVIKNPAVKAAMEYYIVHGLKLAMSAKITGDDYKKFCLRLAALLSIAKLDRKLQKDYFGFELKEPYDGDEISKERVLVYLGDSKAEKKDENNAPAGGGAAESGTAVASNKKGSHKSSSTASKNTSVASANTPGVQTTIKPLSAEDQAYNAAQAAIQAADTSGDDFEKAKNTLETLLGAHDLNFAQSLKQKIDKDFASSADAETKKRVDAIILGQINKKPKNLKELAKK